MRLGAWGLGLLLWAASPSAQGPSLDTVLANAAAYVGHFHRQLSQIVAEESYLQSIKHQQSAFGNPVMLPDRRLKSDLLLVRPEGADRYVEFRDVFEVNGEPLPPGRYLVTLRAVEGTVVRELGESQVLKIDESGHAHMLAKGGPT